jgi:hypothetical protein
MNVDNNTRLPLGELLVQAGLLERANLELALAEQKETGRPVGRILVERGFVSIPAMANALAEQYGGLLKTEYGFATGLTPKQPTEADTIAPPPTSTAAWGKKPWSGDVDVRAPSRRGLSVEDLSQPFVEPVAVAPGAVAQPVQPEPEPVPDEQDEAMTTLLTALDGDDLDAVEAAVDALRAAAARAARAA